MQDAKDNKGVPLGFSSFDTLDYQNVSTTAVQFNTESFIHVDVTPIAGDAWIKVESSEPTAATNEGKLIPFGQFRSVKIPKAYYIVSDTLINVVPYGN